MVREFVFLDTFREQLRWFLDSYGLPTRICDEESRWSEFVKQYAGIIEDGSLSCQSKKQRLSLIKKVVFTKGRSSATFGFLPFYITWRIHLLDGRTITVDVNAASMPDGDPLIANRIHLS
jgi:hypothetical protein